MKKRVILLLVLASLLTGCVFMGGKLRMGTAGAGGNYDSFGTAFAKVLQTDLKGKKVTVKNTAGSAANLRLLSDAYLELAIVQADLLNDAYYGTGVFAVGKSYEGYSAVAGLFTEACQLVVRRDSGIASVADLAGKRVSMGQSESGTEQNAKQILLVYGLSVDMLKEVYLDYEEAAAQLKSGEIDAFFCTVGAPADLITNLLKECDARLVGLDEQQAQKLISTYGFYQPVVIPSGTYEGQDEEVSTVGVRAVLVARDGVDAAAVTRITEALFQNAQTLQESVPVKLELEPETAADGITIPFHPGAAGYYGTFAGVKVNQ